MALPLVAYALWTAGPTLIAAVGMAARALQSPAGQAAVQRLTLGAHLVGDKIAQGLRLADGAIGTATRRAFPKGKAIKLADEALEVVSKNTRVIAGTATTSVKNLLNTGHQAPDLDNEKIAHKERLGSNIKVDPEDGGKLTKIQNNAAHNDTKEPEIHNHNNNDQPIVIAQTQFSP